MMTIKGRKFSPAPSLKIRTVKYVSTFLSPSYHKYLWDTSDDILSEKLLHAFYAREINLKSHLELRQAGGKY